MNDTRPDIASTNVSKLKWRCRRGMRELDEAMLAYLNDHYLQASANEQACFEEMIDMQDPELFTQVSGRSTEARYQDIVDKMARTLGAAAAQENQ